MPEKNRKFLLVGHCGADAWSLTRAIEQAVGGDAVIESVNDERELESHATADAVLLVNRVLDGRFDAGGGIELIRRLNERDDAPPAVLISNFDDAQSQAVEAGAQPGFGKSQLNDARTRDLLKTLADNGG